MKTIKNKELLVGADFAGYPLKEAVVAHLKKKGWKITDVGVRADSDPDDTDLMFHRVGLRVGAMISEGEFERALIFCGKVLTRLGDQKSYGVRSVTSLLGIGHTDIELEY